MGTRGNHETMPPLLFERPELLPHQESDFQRPIFVIEIDNLRCGRLSGSIWIGPWQGRLNILRMYIHYFKFVSRKGRFLDILFKLFEILM